MRKGYTETGHFMYVGDYKYSLKVRYPVVVWVTVRSSTFESETRKLIGGIGGVEGWVGRERVVAEVPDKRYLDHR